MTDTLRGLVAAAVLLSGVVHLNEYFQGFSGIRVIGPLFVANAAGALVIAIAVLVWRHWVPALLATGFGLVTVAAYWFSVVHGLFGVKEVTGGWPEILAETAEYAAIVFGVAVAARLRQSPARISDIPTDPPRRPARAPSGVVTAPGMPDANGSTAAGRSKAPPR